MSAIYLRDSNILVAALKGESARVVNRMVGLAFERLCLSPIVLGGLLTGAEKKPGFRQGEIRACYLVAGLTVLPFDAADATH